LEIVFWKHHLPLTTMLTADAKNMAMVATSSLSLEYQAIDVPKPGPGQILVQISHAAQNPTDGV
jgi:hypothetical protein